MPEKIKPLYLSARNLITGRLSDPDDECLDNVTTDAFTRGLDALIPDEAGMRSTLLRGLSGWGDRELREGEFNTLIGGKSMGIGSSRETAAEAVRLNGINLVIARSFGPIFRDNLIYQGVKPITDIHYFRKLVKGEKVVEGEDLWLFSSGERKVLISGGLPGYIKGIARGRETLPQLECGTTYQVPQTVVEKMVSGWSRVLLEQNIDKQQRWWRAGDSVVLKAHNFTGYDVFWPHVKRILRREFEGKVRLDPKNIWLFSDHFGALDHPHAQAAMAALRDFWAENEGTFVGSDGVYNKVMPLKLPANSVVVGMDSHTPELGLVPGVLPLPVGYTAFACGIGTNGLMRYMIPQTIRMDLVGKVPDHCEMKDVLWGVVRDYFSGTLGDGKMFEFGGSGFGDLSFFDASKLFNMVTEWGGIGAVTSYLNHNVLN
jgi:hypothetical protein